MNYLTARFHKLDQINLTSMKNRFILLFALTSVVRVFGINSATGLPNVCEQLRSDPSVGILSLAIVPLRRQLLILTTNMFAVEVEFFRKFTYPSWAGYPHFLPLHFKEAWTVEISSDADAVFDVLSSEERRQWRAQSAHSPSNQSVVPPTGLLIHNGSRSTYYVTTEDTLGKEERGARRLVWRALDRMRGAERRVVSSDRTVDGSLCVSAQQSSRGYSVGVATDGTRCLTSTDFYAGSTDKSVKVIHYSSSSADCHGSNAVHHHLCGALINELLFVVDNTAKTVSIYQDPILSSRTERIQTVPFAEFFACPHALDSTVLFLVAFAFLSVIAAWCAIMLCCWCCKQIRKKAERARSYGRNRNRRWRQTERYSRF